MADPTPPSDLPDPNSSNPGDPQPGAPAPRRIRSLPERQISSAAANVRSTPERPGGVKPAAGIRSVPEADRRTATTYVTGGLGKDYNWKRGIGILSAVFLLVILVEAGLAFAYVFAGKPGWPPVSYLFLSNGPVLPVDLIRLALLCTFFVGVWVGQGWLRYFFGAVSLLSSVWLFSELIASYHASGKYLATGQTDVPILNSTEVKLTVAAAIAYLVLAVYAFFSTDLKQFSAHRRAGGGVGALLLVTVLTYGALAAILLLPQPRYNNLLQAQRNSAVAFGEDTLKKMSDSWDPTSIDDRIDPGFATGFTPAARQATFANFKDLGRLQDPHTAPAPAATPPPASDPLHKPVSAPPEAPFAVDTAPDGSISQYRAHYDTTGATFEHGSVRFILDLSRDPVGPWRITKLDAKDVNIQRPKRATPPPAPAATPLPDGTTPSAVPTGTVSTATTDAAAPSPSATPATATPAVPTPAASATPAASPAASVSPTPPTGG